MSTSLCIPSIDLLRLRREYDQREAAQLAGRLVRKSSFCAAIMAKAREIRMESVEREDARDIKIAQQAERITELFKEVADERERSRELCRRLGIAREETSMHANAAEAHYAEACRLRGKLDDRRNWRAVAILLIVLWLGAVVAGKL